MLGLTVLRNNASYFAIMIESDPKTTAERAQRHRVDLSRKIDLLLSEVAVIRRKVDALDGGCPLVQVVGERRAADRAIAASLSRERS